MIYSINESFFNNGKPNKIIAADVKAAENKVKELIKYFEDALKVITEMRNTVCKENFTDKDTDKIKACMQKLTDLDKASADKADRKLTIAVNNLIRSTSKKDLDELKFSDDTTDEYKALVKKVSAHGQYTKQLQSIAHKFFKLNDDYTKMYNKRDKLSNDHNSACEQFGGMVGWMIGSMPVVRLGLGKVDN